MAFEFNRQRVGRILKWTGAVLGSLILVLCLVLALIDWNALRGPISRFASARLHRPVAINGALEVHLWSLTPRVSVAGLTIGNAQWDAHKNMLEIERADVELKLLYLLRGAVVLPLVSVQKPALYLHREKSGRANWEFTARSSAPSSKPMKLPLIRRFVVSDGQVDVVDEIRKLKFEGTVQAQERAGADQAKPFRLEGKGELNDKPFALKVAGGPLINLDPNESYSFDATLQAPDVQLQANGTLPKPFDLGQLTVDLKVSGKDLADIFYLTGLALPNTPPYRLAMTLERDAALIRMTKISGTVGSSDLRGELSVDTGGERPSMKGELASKLLDFADLAAPLGTKVAVQPVANAQNKEAAAKPTESKITVPPDQPLLPDARLQVNRVRAMDADIHYAAQAVNAGKLPLKRVVLGIKLNNGVLHLQPLALEFPQGKLTGIVTVDASQAVPQTDIDVRLFDLHLDQFVAHRQDAQPAFTGAMQARAKLHGSGDSIHRVASTANGNITVVVPHGEVRAAFAELTGINVARGLGLLLTKDRQQTPLRCGIADFQVHDGTMQAQNLVFDTQDVLITGKGEVRLQPEELELTIKGEPKKLRLLRLRAPIEIRGHLRKPAIGIDAGKTAGQAGIATAIGAIFAPLAAVVAFVDPGLAKDADCAALFAEANSKGAATSGDQRVSNTTPQ